MPQRIGPKRLQHLLDAGVDLHNLEPEQRFQAFATMGRILLAPPTCTPKRDRPRCGAKCRDGHRCQAKAVWDKDHDCPRTPHARCRQHGGLSTGPKSYEGRRRIGMANRQRAQARRLAKVQAAAQASALAAYEAAVKKYEALRQQDMSGFPGLQTALRQVQWRQVEIAYQQCRDCGVDPHVGGGS